MAGNSPEPIDQRPMPRHLRLIFAALSALAFAGMAAAAPVKTQYVEAELVSERTAFVPGQALTVALRLRMADGWHTYWRNPGDSGLPTTIKWTLPEGAEAGPILWPAPYALPVGPLMNFGYEGEVLLLTDIKPPATAAPGETLTLAAKAEWLVCRETCIPEEAELSLALPVSNRSDPYPQWGRSIATARALLPGPVQGWLGAARGDGAKVVLTLTAPADADPPGELQFFPYEEGRIEASGKQTLVREANGTYALTLPVAHQLAPDFKRVAGVITASRGFANGNMVTPSLALEVPLAGAVVAGPKPVTAAAPALNLEGGSAKTGGSEVSLVLALAFALVGGVILNLMPCVFPVLSLKVLSLSRPEHGSWRALRAEGIAYGVGVIASFVGLAVLLLVLRAAGQQLGWGFQLQSPAVITGLALLFFVLALNMSGTFEFATLAPPSAAGWTARNRYVNAGLTGVLAVAIASPCTAPFMGAALGFALAQPAALTLLVFAALGVGMALPFVLLTWFPGWRRRLPRPGAWMERLKQFLAFPLYATVAWLAWVLGAQLDNDAVMRLMVTLVFVAFALWSWRLFRGGAARAFGVLAAVGIAAALIIAWPLFGDAPEDQAAGVNSVAPARAAGGAIDPWKPWSPVLLREISQTRPVFVDFTAAWCVTCQVNKRLVLNDPRVREAFAQRGVEMLRADWTRRDPQITQALAALGRQGVPVYVLYRPGKEPLLLPEVLQKQIVFDALATI